MPTTVAEGALVCPRCGHALISAGKGPSWCPDCEWNLGELGAELDDVSRTWRWLVRRCHRTAFRLDGELFQKYSASRPEKQETSIAGAILLLISLALMSVVVGATVWAIVLFSYSFLGVLAGVGLLLAAFALRPRLGRLPKRLMRLKRERYPALFALVEEVAAAAGTRPPDVIAVDFSHNAATGRAGLRQRRVLILGMPMWLVLEPRPRVALLAHELGHQVNGDPARSLLVRPALQAFGMLGTRVFRRSN